LELGWNGCVWDIIPKTEGNVSSTLRMKIGRIALFMLEKGALSKTFLSIKKQSGINQLSAL
jgi:hypothetical protein